MVPAATNVRAGPDRRLPRDRARPSPIASLPCHLVADPFFAQQLFRLDSDTDQLRTQLASILDTGAVRCAPARQGSQSWTCVTSWPTSRSPSATPLGDRRRPPTRVHRRIARRGVPTQLRRHHRDVYRLTFSKSPRRSVRLSMDQPSSAGPAPAASTHPSVGEDGAAIRTCRISEQSRRNLHGGDWSVNQRGGHSVSRQRSQGPCGESGHRRAPTSAVSFTTFTKRMAAS